jgi:outer membrane protein assembly factor BamB
MSQKRLFSIVIFLILFIGGFVLYTNKAFLYTGMPTHYNLTQEMVKFYNLNFDPDITPHQLELILKGSLDEDTPPRYMYHLYDPIYNRAPFSDFGVHTAKEWALSSDIQQSSLVTFASVIYKLLHIDFQYHGDYSWPAAIKFYQKGSLDQAYYGLGHILHLIEDMTVPAHSRNDPHLPGNEDPYETWTVNNDDLEAYNWAEPLYNNGYQPTEFYTIGEYFDKLAQYSNVRFFSLDSVPPTELSKDYFNPVIVKEQQEDFGRYSQRIYAMGKDENRELFRLAFKDIEESNWRKLSPDANNRVDVYTIDDTDPKLNTDYWNHLAPKAVMYGAGTIKLFLEEVGQEIAETPPKKIPEIASIINPIPLENKPIIQPEIKGESTEKPEEQEPAAPSINDTGNGSIVVTGPKTGGGGGTSRQEIQQPASTPAPASEEPPMGGEEIPQDTTPPDVLIKPLIYNYASSSLFVEWSSAEIPSVSFDVEYKQGNEDWQNLLASTSETQASLSVSIQDIVYYFRIRGRDTEDNQSNWQEKSIEILSKPVVINEIAWMGTLAEANDEWIELYNQADYDIDLSDWVLKSDDSSPEIIFTNGDTDNKATINKIIPAKGYYLLERTNDETTSKPADWYGSFGSGGLKNTGEVLELRDSTDNLIDSVDSWYAGSNEDKKTMERVSPAALGNISQNWQTYVGSGSGALDADNNPILGTPKAQNSVYDIGPPTKIDDLTINDSLGAFLILQWTAPADEKSSISLVYDFRYASESINEENWASLSQVSDIPLVDNPGFIQMASVSGLKYDTTYYFALKTSDGLNVSEISNILIYSTGSPPVLANSPWPLFQKDVGHTGLSSYNGPDFTASSSITPKWISDLGAPIYASPVIGLDDTIYVGDIMGKLYALNPITGEPKWVYDTFNHELQRGGIYFSAAIASDGTIYFSAFGSYLYALTPNGKLKWKYQIGGINTGGSFPVIGSDGTIYLTNLNGDLFAINPDGTLKWRYNVPGAFSVSAPALGSDGTIYISSNGSSPSTSYLIAFDSEGNVKWIGENINPMTGQALSLDDNDIIYNASAIGGSLRAINPANGLVIWAYNARREVFSSSAIGPTGNIYVVNRAGMLHAVDSGGNFIWIFSAEGGVCNSPIVDSNEVIYFGAEDKKIYAINSDGTLKWSYELSDAVYSSPIIAQDGTIYIGTADGKLYAIGE